MLRLLPPTTVPVICVPYTRTLLALPIPSLRAGLFVGNNAHNLHLLRRSGVRSAFIGHGDSDKGASANPFSRVYNEIWVAGPAGRERYRDAGVDVPDGTTDHGKETASSIGTASAAHIWIDRIRPTTALHRAMLDRWCST